MKLRVALGFYCAESYMFSGLRDIESYHKGFIAFAEQVAAKPVPCELGSPRRPALIHNDELAQEWFRRYSQIDLTRVCGLITAVQVVTVTGIEGGKGLMIFGEFEPSGPMSSIVMNYLEKGLLPRFRLRALNVFQEQTSALLSPPTILNNVITFDLCSVNYNDLYIPGGNWSGKEPPPFVQKVKIDKSVDGVSVKEEVRVQNITPFIEV